MFKKSLPILFTLIPTTVLADQVNVYSYRQPSLVEPLFKEFTSETGISVKVQFLNKGLVERLVAEGKRSPADIVLTTDISRLYSLVEAGVTQPISSDVLEDAIPDEFRDPQGRWFGLTTRARIVYASKDRVEEGEISTYEDLADPKWKGRICIRSGTNAYNLALTSAVIAKYDTDTAKSWLSGLKDNLARKPQGNDRAQVKAIHAGECDISVGNTYYMKQMLADSEQQEWANSVRIEFPTFEGGGTHVNLSGIAMTQSAPNKENALRLMEWLVSETAQEIYASVNGEYPVTENVTVDPLVASWGDFTPENMSLTEIAKLRGASLRLVEEVAFDE